MKYVKNICIAVLISTASVSASIAGDKPAQIAEETAKWREATEAELKKRYSNRTVTGTAISSGNTFKLHFKSDGTYESRCCAYSWNHTSDGTWSVDGNKVCTTRKSGSRAGETTCRNLLTDGKEFKTDDGITHIKNMTWEDGNQLP